MKKLLIGGQALVTFGSSRSTSDVDYLIFDESNENEFSHEPGIDYLNAAANEFFAAVWNSEKENETEVASPQAILELKAYALVQHCQNGNWQKADDCEYDIKFLVRAFGVNTVKIANKFISAGEMKEVQKIINSVKI